MMRPLTDYTNEIKRVQNKTSNLSLPTAVTQRTFWSLERHLPVSTEGTSILERHLRDLESKHHRATGCGGTLQSFQLYAPPPF